MFKGKKVLVVGMARTGIPTVEALYKVGAEVDVTDIKKEETLKDILENIEGFIKTKIFGTHPDNIGKYDYLLLSPGVPTDLPFINEAREKGVKVIGEIELAYLISKGTFIGITGTNGKTTTTALTGAIYKNAEVESFVVGNIGVAAISKAFDTTENTKLITELSSFQLESVEKFNPHIAAILNVTPDHLNRHKTMDNYTEAKCNVYKNQTEDDYLILNYDNEVTRNIGKDAKSQIIFFSRKEQLDRGFFVRDGKVVAKFDEEEEIFAIDDMMMFGGHNVENALAATAICYLNGISKEVIRKTMMEFGGYEHRFEYIGEVNGVKYINDSKGTNPDSSIQAVKSVTVPTVLIAGGQDKKSTFDELIENFNGKIKHLVLLGETAEIIKETAERHGFNKIKIVKDMDEAVAFASEIAQKGECVVLSPACASWDMYESFEHRGAHFKRCVDSLRG